MTVTIPLLDRAAAAPDAVAIASDDGSTVERKMAKSGLARDTARRPGSR